MLARIQNGGQMLTQGRVRTVIFTLIFHKIVAVSVSAERAIEYIIALSSIIRRVSVDASGKAMGTACVVSSNKFPARPQTMARSSD